jgi:flagellar hook-basal body protein
MSLFGSLFTGVSALSGQSQATAMISNNIANVNTTGFKRSEAAFYSLVTTEGRSSRYSPGTVAVNRIQRVDQQGPIQQTSSSTDVAISGNGFFAVKRDSDPNSDNEFLYTRNGSFSEDSQGFLRNTAGFYLYGWPLDSDNNIPAASGDLSSLTTVDVAFLGGLTRPTTSGQLAINLDASENNINNGTLSGTTQVGTSGFTGLPIPSTQPADFTRALRVYDTLGSSQDLTFQVRKITGPMANVQSNVTAGLELSTDLTSLTGITAGDTFTVAATGTAAQEFIIGAVAGAGQVRIDTVGDLVSYLNTTYGGGAEIDASISTNGQLVLQTRTITDTLTVAETSGTPLFNSTALGFPNPNAPAVTETFSPFTLDGSSAQSSSNPYGFTPSGGQNQSVFPDLADATTPNTRGWWEMTILYPDGSIASQGLVNFNSDGSINAALDASGNIDLELSNLNWNNGSELQDISVDISRFSQFSGNYNVVSSDQNGAELGLRTGIEIDREGFVVARFSNGASAKLYKLPLITFSNPNGLTEVSGTAYSENEQSGEENLKEAGRGGAGFLETATIESSNVDLADEFAKLIVSQRAFSAGTKVITTVDQMTSELLNIR